MEEIGTKSILKWLQNDTNLYYMPKDCPTSDSHMCANNFQYFLRLVSVLVFVTNESVI